MPWRHVKTIALTGRAHRAAGAAPRWEAAGSAIQSRCSAPARRRRRTSWPVHCLKSRSERSSAGSAARSSCAAPHSAALCAGADLVAMEVPRAWQACLPAGAQLRMPAWVSQELLAAGKSPVTLPAPIRKEVRRHSRRNAYELRFSTDVSDVRRFYANLYRPYVTARFGAGAVLVDETAVPRRQSRNDAGHADGRRGLGCRHVASAARRDIASGMVRFRLRYRLARVPAKYSTRAASSGVPRRASAASSWGIPGRALQTVSCATRAALARPSGQHAFRSGPSGCGSSAGLPRSSRASMPRDS